MTSKKIEIKDFNYYKTFNYYTINLNIIIGEWELFNYSFTEFKIFEKNKKYYIHTFHYSRLFEICKKNFFSNEIFKPKNLEYFKKKINLKLYIDYDIQLELENKNKIFNDIKENNDKLLKKYEDKNWTSETKNEIAEIQKKNAKLNEKMMIILFMQNKIKSEIFFPIFIDFRGRKYYDSIIGPTFCKTLRTCYYYGNYNENDFLNLKPSNEITTYSDKIKKICEKNKIEYEDFFYDIIYWCVIGIGKFLINKNDIPIDEFVFIDLCEKYLNGEICDNFKLEDQIEINHYIKILKSLKKNELWNIKKWVIIKDATASVNQILIKALQPKNQNSLNYLNLGEKNQWYDTYTVCKEKFIENIGYIPNLNVILQRKLIKKIIMTIPYSAGFKLCWQNYINTIKKEKIDIEINNDLKKIINKFYKFIKYELQEKYLYKESSINYFKKINKEFEEKRIYKIISETGEADISYFIMKKTSIDRKILIKGKIKRITKQIWEITNAIDLNSFISSSGANTTHFHDADEIRDLEIILNKYFITIHDCYLVDILSCTSLIKARQLHYQEKIPNYTIKNIFILL